MKTKEIKKEKKASKVLGIIGLCIFWIPTLSIISLILGIIGLSIGKSEKHKQRDIILNVLALVLGLVFNTIYYYMGFLDITM